MDEKLKKRILEINKLSQNYPNIMSKACEDSLRYDFGLTDEKFAEINDLINNGSKEALKEMDLLIERINNSNKIMNRNEIKRRKKENLPSGNFIPLPIISPTWKNGKPYLILLSEEKGQAQSERSLAKPAPRKPIP